MVKPTPSGSGNVPSAHWCRHTIPARVLHHRLVSGDAVVLTLHVGGDRVEVGGVDEEVVATRRVAVGDGDDVDVGIGGERDELAGEPLRLRP